MTVISLLFLSSLSFTLWRLQDPEFLIQRAKDINLYGRLSEPLVKFLDSAKPSSDGQGFGLQAEIIIQAIPPEEFYLFLEQFLTATLGYLTGQKDDLTFRYSLSASKERVELATTDRLLAEYRALPTCQTKQLKGWDFDEQLPDCQLAASGGGQTDITRLANQLAKSQLAGLPNDVTIEEPSDKLIAARAVVSNLTRLFQLIWFSTVAGIVGYIIVWRRRAWFGLAAACLSVGIIEVAFSLIAWDWLAKSVQELIGGSQSLEMTAALIDLTAVLLEVMKTIWGNLAIGLLSAGAVFLVLGLASRLPKPAKAPTTVSANR